MIIGILTRNPRGWASSRLAEAVESLGHKPFLFRFRDVVTIVGEGALRFIVDEVDLAKEVSAVIVRPFGRVSLDQAIYRIDLLYALEEQGVVVINKPSAIEKCVDKFRALYTLHVHGIPVAKTVVGESTRRILQAAADLGAHSVVVKPVFGSRGHGSTMVRLRDRDILWEVLRSMEFTRHVLYVQRFLPHGGRDIRVFVVGDQVIAAMYRVAPGRWKTNVAQGAQPVGVRKLDPEVEDIALRAAKILGCEIAGVDIIPAEGRYYVSEVNSQPGWRGLQSVTEKNIALEIAKYVVEKAKK